MAKFTKFISIAVVFIIAIPTGVLGQEMTKEVKNAKMGFRTVHLINLKTVDDEAEITAIANDFNKVVLELGYHNISYKFWKETSEIDGQYKYIFESTWPDQETYDEVHEYDKFKEAWEKNYAKWKTIIVEDVYNRYFPLN